MVLRKLRQNETSRVHQSFDPAISLVGHRFVEISGRPSEEEYCSTPGSKCCRGDAPGSVLWAGRHLCHTSLPAGRERKYEATSRTAVTDPRVGRLPFRNQRLAYRIAISRFR